MFCVKRKWIAENPASDLDAPVGAGAAANRMPFTDAELNRIYDACDALPGVEWKNNLGTGVWTGDVKTMVMLLCWTGLRISDAATFDMNRVTPHPAGGANVFLRMHKTKGALFTWVADWLYERLRARERVLGPKIFALGRSDRLDTATDLWRRKIHRVFSESGPFECSRPTPHICWHGGGWLRGSLNGAILEPGRLGLYPVTASVFQDWEAGPMNSFNRVAIALRLRLETPCSSQCPGVPHRSEWPAYRTDPSRVDQLVEVGTSLVACR